MLPWDTEFFGRRTGRVLLNQSTDETEAKTALTNELPSWETVYAFVDPAECLPKFEDLLKHLNFRLMEIKLTMRKAVNQARPNPVISDYSFELFGGPHPDSELIALAITSGEHSRFRQDKVLDSFFEPMYRKWIANTVANASGHVMVVKDGDRKVGLVSATEVNDRLKIELVAIDSAYQGKGIGKLLLQAFDGFAFHKGCTEIEVATQNQNLAARKLYEALGFEDYSRVGVFHFHN